ncbi:hypothetical protein JCM21738_2388 [Mesobacillus boroniphilus JCM 21738]|uniref:Hemerythrin-like domain-containing protein n=1 Tax=Mesobacillus boroniphilus JCM 21738 TaxID=1294265 RepID=W4RPP1_9BACI|nr:hypothetical protein JCM21738_2388 [Mesobacillus boroniphilus JCM 21738]
MSEMINNRELKAMDPARRKATLKQLFKDLHDGKNVNEVKAHFDAFIGKITIEEIAGLQHVELIEGDISVTEMQRIYAAHADLFKGAIEEKDSVYGPENQPGHPVHTFELENREIEQLLQNRLRVHLEQFAMEDSAENINLLLEDCNLLYDIDKHYSRKENLIFPYLEKYGIYGPTTNMWRIDDFIRDGIKLAKKKLANYDGDKNGVIEEVQFVLREVSDMIYREENILFPMALQNFTEDEWVKIAHESDEIGYCLTAPAQEWKPARNPLDADAISEGYIKMETGILSLKQLELLLNHLPVDITFIDQDDVVRYFSHGKEGSSRAQRQSLAALSRIATRREASMSSRICCATSKLAKKTPKTSGSRSATNLCTSVTLQSGMRIINISVPLNSHKTSTRFRRLKEKNGYCPKPTLGNSPTAVAFFSFTIFIISFIRP